MQDLEKLVEQDAKQLEEVKLEPVYLQRGYTANYPDLGPPVSVHIDYNGIVKQTTLPSRAQSFGINDSFIEEEDEDEGTKEMVKVDKDLEIREVYETRTDSNSGPELKKYLVHLVQPATDTLFQLSYKYKVSKREIQYVNKFTGDDIYFMTEILIPYRGAHQLSQTAKKVDTEKSEEMRRAGCLIMLNNYISRMEVKMSHQGKIASQKMGRTYRQESSFYLVHNNWNYKLAQQEYNQDLQFEIDSREKQKQLKALNKGKRRSLMRGWNRKKDNKLITRTTDPNGNESSNSDMDGIEYRSQGRNENCSIFWMRFNWYNGIDYSYDEIE